MIQRVLEDLEQKFNEANQLKHELNNVCENCWDILNTSGNKCNESFTIQNNINSSFINTISDGTSLLSSKKDLLNNASDLITYGKHIRTTAKDNYNNGIKQSFNILKLPLQYSGMNEGGTSLIKSKCSRELSKNRRNVIKTVERQHVKETPNTELFQKPTLNKEKIVSAKKDMYNRLNKNDEYCSASENITQMDSIINNKMASEVVYNNVFTKAKYSHLCSLTLLESVKMCKMPEDLCYLLKHYYSYEHHKLKFTLQGQEQNTSNFMDIFYQKVKSRLEDKLRTNLKQENDYVKYVNIADEVCIPVDKATLGGLNMQYQSDEELSVYELKHQHLMELLLEGRIINIISDNLTV